MHILLRRTVFAVLPLLLTVSPVQAEQADFLSVIGNFIVDGLAPARTLEDIQRDEQEAAMRKLQKERAAEAARDKAQVAAGLVATAPLAAPAAEIKPVAAPVVQSAEGKPAGGKPDEIKSVGVKSAGVKIASVEPAAAVVAPIERKADFIAPPPARPQQHAKVTAPVDLPPPEPLKSRIAATASLEQAFRLGAVVKGGLGGPASVITGN